MADLINTIIEIVVDIVKAISGAVEDGTFDSLSSEPTAAAAE